MKSLAGMPLPAGLDWAALDAPYRHAYQCPKCDQKGRITNRQERGTDCILCPRCGYFVPGHPTPRREAATPIAVEIARLRRCKVQFAKPRKAG